MARVAWPRVGSLVLVQWLDADGPDKRDAGDTDGRDLRPVENETVGWLCKRTSVYLYVACERCPPGLAERYRGTTRIPNRWVRAVVRIAGP